MSKNTQPESHATFYTKNGLIVFLPVIIYVIFGASMYQLIEGFRPIDSYYFVVITLSTIGYGDIFPHTDLGKLFTIFYVVIGLALFSGLISTLVARGKARKEKRQELKMEKRSN